MSRARKSGSRHWLRQRLTALLLVPASSLFALPFLRTFGGSQAEVLATYNHPLNALVAALFLGTAFVHLHQGLHEVVEDYAHSRFWLTILHTANATFCWLMALLAVLAVARIAFAGAV